MRAPVVGRLGCGVAMLMLGAVAAAQDSLADRMLQSAASAVEGAIGREADAATFRAACAAARSYLDALGKASESRAARLVLDELERHESGPFLIADKTATALFDEVRFHRTRGRPERMIPALLTLKARYPDDARVLFALGEAFGVAGVMFDAERSERNFRQLLEVLAEQTEVGTEAVGRGQLLAAFLPELGRAGLLLEEKAVDTTGRLRQQVLAYCEQLAAGHPIGIWLLADPQIKRLYERLSIARRRADQVASRKLLEAMLELQPVNPVLHHLLAEVRASLGPEFDPEVAIEHLDAFLELTDPAVLDATVDSRSVVMTAERVVADLERFRLADARSGLEKQRIAAIELQELLAAKSKDRDFHGLLLAPDADEAKKEIRRLELRRKSKESYLVRARNNADKMREALRRTPDTPRNRSRRMEYERKLESSQRDADELQQLVDELTRQIEQLEKFAG